MLVFLSIWPYVESTSLVVTLIQQRDWKEMKVTGKAVNVARQACESLHTYQSTKCNPLKMTNSTRTDVTYGDAVYNRMVEKC